MERSGARCVILSLLATFERLRYFLPLNGTGLPAPSDPVCLPTQEGRLLPLQPPFTGAPCAASSFRSSAFGACLRGAFASQGKLFLSFFGNAAHFSPWRCDVTPLVFPSLCSAAASPSAAPPFLKCSLASGWTWISPGKTLTAPRGESGAPRR